jgi:peptidoglycan/LPS O-acetylase OafA/YrhL
LSVSDAGPRLDGLTGLRFLAALWVVLFHAKPAFLPGWDGPLVNLAGMGFAGVGLFFILSGFVLGHRYGGRGVAESGGYTGFMAARFARVYPVYLVGLAVTAPQFWRDIAYQAAQGPDGMLRTGGLTVLRHLGLMQSWVPWSACQWNCPGWSLSAEIFFYALFPLAGVAAGRLSGRRTVAALLGLCLLGLAVPGLVESSTALRAWAESAPGRLLGVYETVMYTPVLRLPEFLVGVLLARLFALGWRLPAPAGLAAVGGLAALGMVWTPPRPDMLVSNGALTPLFAVLILGVAGGRDWLGRVLASPVLVRLGEASFAVYILHYGILRAMVPGNNVPPLYMGDGALVLYLAATMAASLLTYHVVERPARVLILRAVARVRRHPSPVPRGIPAALPTALPAAAEPVRELAPAR